MFERLKRVKRVLGPRPLPIGIGDTVKATRNCAITDPNINLNVEGLVIEVRNGELLVRTDDGETYNCFSAGAVRLEDRK